MSTSAQKDLRKVFKILEEQGWRIERRTRHYWVIPPDPSQPGLAIPTSPHGGKRGWDNMRADLRRRGAKGL